MRKVQQKGGVTMADAVAQAVVSPVGLVKCIVDVVKKRLKKSILLVLGAPGIGKTEIIGQAARAMGMVFVEVIPSMLEPTEIMGQPWVVKDEKTGEYHATHLPFSIFSTILNASKPTLVLIDDLGHSTDLVQAALMNLVRNRELNSHKIPDCITFIMASNRTSDKGAGVRGVITPLQDRTCMITLKPDQKQWAYAMVHDPYTQVLEVVEETISSGDYSDDGRDGVFPADLVAYTSWKASHITDPQPSKMGEPTPSPRSLTNLGTHLQAGEMPESVALSLMAGYVGMEVASEYMGFRRVLDGLPDIDKITTDPENVDIPHERPDICFALTGLLPRLAAEDGEEVLGNVLQFAGRMKSEYRRVFQRNFEADKDLVNTKEYRDFRNKYFQSDVANTQ
jgi:hypothetical protein